MLENYKIRVNNESESKEAQELFEKLGYEIEVFIPIGFPRWLVTTDCGEDYWYSTGFDLCAELSGFKELTLPQLRELVSKSKNEQVLISGADALRSLADGKEVEFKHDTQGWVPCLGLNIEQVVGGLYQLRLKPRTKKIELEIPEPFEPKVGEKYWYLKPNAKDGFDWALYHGDSTDFNQLGAWRTEEEIKQVVAALRGALK